MISSGRRRRNCVCAEPIPGTPEAEGALAWAAAMARREGCDISLVYAIRNVSIEP